jgi:hypothetical protein
MMFSMGIESVHSDSGMPKKSRGLGEGCIAAGEEKMGWPCKWVAQASPVPQICVVAICFVRLSAILRKITEVA